MQDMKHAIIIMAHGKLDLLYNLADHFNQDCCVFIHIDTKTIVSSDYLNKLLSLKQVKAVYQKYNIHWGGFSILKCEIFLLKEALSKCNADYFHLISGQDYPACSLDYFLHFFEENNGIDFIQYVHLPHPRWEGKTFSRFQYFYPYDYFEDGKKSYSRIRTFVSFQKKHLIKRRIPDYFDHLYGNSQWFSICRNSALKLIEYTKKSPALYRRLKMTFAPEECYISTVLVNLLGKGKIIPFNFRFIRWYYENGNRPANLGVEHFHFLLERKYLFARKMSGEKSLDLIKLINKYLINDDNTFSITSSGGWIYDGYLKYSYEEPFMQTIFQFCINFSICSVLDMGCGAGMYVAMLRQKGISIAGYDANPYTSQLSSRILPPNDNPCEQANLIDDLYCSSKFDLVICKDVLPYIPAEYENKAISNLKNLTGTYLLISWYTDTDDKLIRCKCEDDVVNLFIKAGFIILKEYTSQLRESIKDSQNNKYYLFKQFSNNLI